jgi:cell division protein FtsI (penicillin-binding protein 3)
MSAHGLAAPRPAPWRWIGDAIWRIEHEFERAKAENRASDNVRVRMVFILALFMAGFVALGVGATRAALFTDGVRSPWRASLPPGSRADLVDRNGQLLAIDLPVYSLYLDPELIWDTEETRRVLGPLAPAESRARLERALAGDRRLKIFGPFTSEIRDRIDGLGLPGVSFEMEAGRSYPLGPTASHLIGYARNDGQGMAGAEGALDEQVRAAAGQGPVMLSLDLKVQAALEEELTFTMERHAALAAVGVVTTVRTGEILAMASLPDAEPGLLAESGAARQNRAAGAVYEMGSTFKVFAFAMGLDSGRVDLNDVYDVATPLRVRGQTINDSHRGDGVYDLRQVFLESSNIGTAKMALDVGPDIMGAYYQRFGLTETVPVELAEATRPLAPTDWTEQVAANTSFGHGIAVSPLHVAAGMGAILNGGEYVPLTILRRDDAPAPLRRVISPATSRMMLDLMRDNAVEGTGKNAERLAPGFSLGGKTGTAEKPENGTYARNKLVSSFAAVFPTDGPLDADRYLVLVLFDEPHTSAEQPGRPTGGIVGAPTAGRVINRIAPFLGVPRTSSEPEKPPVVIADAAPVGVLD